MIRIGIAEDDQAYIDQIQEYLNQYRKETGEVFSVRVFRDGFQLAFDYKPEFDILLLDVQMPKMDCYEATRAIRALADEGRAGVPIVAMTANNFVFSKSLGICAFCWSELTVIKSIGFCKASSSSQ